MTKERKLTSRGFTIYGEFVDCYGSEITVQESSITGDPCCWVYCYRENKDFTPHLTVPQAKQLIQLLEDFVSHSESRGHWKNESSYKKAFRQDD
jgi:hypothetical protein